MTDATNRPESPEDPRTSRTRARLRTALLRECGRAPLAEVTVSAVARRAEVGRATFYLHYDDLDALAVDACAEVVRAGVDALHAWRGLPDPDTPPPALVAFVVAVRAHSGLYRQLLRPGGAGPLGELLHRQLRERSLAERQRAGARNAEWAASAVAATFTGLLADWLHGLVDGEPTEFAARAWRLLLAVHHTSS